MYLDLKRDSEIEQSILSREEYNDTIKNCEDDKKL